MSEGKYYSESDVQQIRNVYDFQTEQYRQSSTYDAICKNLSGRPRELEADADKLIKTHGVYKALEISRGED